MYILQQEGGFTIK